MRVDPQYNADSRRQLRQHPDAGPARRQVHRPQPGRLGHLPEGRQPHRSDAVGDRAREPDQQVLCELRQQGGSGDSRAGDSQSKADNQKRSPRNEIRDNCVWSALLADVRAWVLHGTGDAAARRQRRRQPARRRARVPRKWCRPPPRACSTIWTRIATPTGRIRPRSTQLVDKYLLPHFDTEYSARLVLGQHWRTATAEQRKRFIDAFYHSLLNNYGSALVDFTSDRLKIFPTKVDPDAKRATVRTEVKRSNGDRVSVNYYLHKTPEGWKAWDVVIDGISYVKSYREDFGAQIDAAGHRRGDQAPRDGRKAGRHRQADRRLMASQRPYAAGASPGVRSPSSCCRGRTDASPPRVHLPSRPRARRARSGARRSRPPRAALRRSTAAASAPPTVPGLRCCSTGWRPRARRAVRCATPTCRQASPRSRRISEVAGAARRRGV